MHTRSVEFMPVPWSRASGLGLLALLALAGCSGLESVASYEAVTDPTQLYMTLRLEQRAFNLSTAAGYNTVQLMATPYDGRSAAMTGLSAPTFRLRNAGDAIKLEVTPEGLVTAHQIGSNLEVIAELTIPGPGQYPVRHADTARINVKNLASPPVLASVSIDPVSPDSAIWPISSISNAKLKSVARDEMGQSISGLLVEYASLDPAIATVDRWTGSVKSLRPGQVRMMARTTAYGVIQVDTALFTVTWPTSGIVEIHPAPGGAVFEPSEIRIVPYGSITWRNYLADSVDVTFDDTSNVADPSTGGDVQVVSLCNLVENFFMDPSICAPGNILMPGLSSDAYLNIRQFPVSGVYTFRSIRTGAVGRLIVTDEIPVDAAP